MKTIKGANTRLEKRVQGIVNRYAKDYESGVKGFMDDLMQGGCQSGMISELIYYNDTVRFYKTYKAEINAMLKETMSDLGANSPADVFGDRWDTEDIFAEDTNNQNLLAWFGFEETARKLASDNGIEI